MATKSVNFSQVHLWQSGLILLCQEPRGFRNNSYFFQRVVSLSLSVLTWRGRSGSPPPLKPSAFVASAQAEPRERKRKSINITNASPIHLLLSNLASLSSRSPNSPCRRPHYTKSRCFACNQIPRHFSLLEKQSRWRSLLKSTEYHSKFKSDKRVVFFPSPPPPPRELFFFKCRGGHKDNYKQSQFKYSWLHRRLAWMQRRSGSRNGLRQRRWTWGAGP